MPLISFKKVTKYFGAQDILHEADWTIEEGRKIGLIGTNGTGKTTIFRMILGEEETNAGNISKTAGLSIGLLRQSMDLAENTTMWQAMMQAQPDLPKVEAAMKQAEHDMADPEISENPAQLKKVMDAYADLQSRFASMDGYGFEARIKEVLGGMRFTADQYDRPLSSFSGGERTRMMLARLLLENPKLLLLDEPTNHLDTETAEWLEAYLCDFKGTLVAISHDRWFLDHVTNEITELSQHKLRTFPGNYSRYKELKKEDLKAALRAYEEQQDFIEKEEGYIRTNIAGRQSKGASGRRTRLKRLDRLDNPIAKEKKISINFNAKGPSGKEVARFEAISKSFGSQALFEPFEGTIYRGERIGLIGPNGAGKSTLLRVLCGQLDPDTGQATVGGSVAMGYYDQMQDDLNPDKTVLDTLWDLVPGEGHQVARGIAGRFLFGEGDVEKKVKSLSGGEKARLILARLVLQGPNFLVMDEPTNHLDIPSREVVEGALDEFEGTLLAVSHDRYFLDREVTQIWEIASGHVRIFKGNYSEYLAEKARGGQGQIATVDAPVENQKPTAVKQAVSAAVDPVDKQKRIENREKQKREDRTRLRKISDLKKRLNDIQKEIEKLEMQKKEIEDEFLNPEVGKQPERLKELSQKQKTIADSLDARFFKWQELEDRMKGIEEGADE